MARKTSKRVLLTFTADIGPLQPASQGWEVAVGVLFAGGSGGLLAAVSVSSCPADPGRLSGGSELASENEGLQMASGVDGLYTPGNRSRNEPIAWESRHEECFISCKVVYKK